MYGSTSGVKRPWWMSAAVPFGIGQGNCTIISWCWIWKYNDLTIDRQKFSIKWINYCIDTCLLRHTKDAARETSVSYEWSLCNNGNIKYLVGDRVDKSRTPGIFLRSEKLSGTPLTTPDTRTVIVVNTDELRRSGIMYPIAVANNCRALIWIAMYTKNYKTNMTSCLK